MKKFLTTVLEEIVGDLGVKGVDVQVGFNLENQHGDFTTNVAFIVAKKLHRKPLEMATDIVVLLKRLQTLEKTQVSGEFWRFIKEISVAGSGFINITISGVYFSALLSEVLDQKKGFGTSLKKTGKKLMVEFAHPNTHKAFHIGHLRNITTGESIVRLLEAAGNEVVRVNYQGDVGMHIAKCLYGLQLPIFKSKTSEAEKLSLDEKITLLGKAYAAGSKAFDEDEQAKKEIGELNKQIYEKDQSIYKLYQSTRKWSLDYFDHIYKRVGSKFDRLYFESEVFESGKKIVEEFLSKGVFVKSEGAIIFPGEKYGLHNRVFITGEGNPTYEGKDIGLAKLQFEQYHPDLIIHVVGPEQSAYFQVLFKALELVFPHIQGKEKHLIYGWVKLKEGKMSSRSGNVVLGEWLIDEAEKEVCNILLNSKSNYTKEYQNEITEKAAIAAVKYSFLRVSTRQEISFDLKTSVSFDGDSGPYLQYTYARCKSVLRKAKRPTESDLTPVRDENVQKLPSMQKELLNLDPNYLYNPEEREIARLITLFPYVVIQAATEYTPNVVCTYLFNLAQAYNVFYAQHSILGTDNKKTYSSGSADEVIQSEAKNSTSAIKTTKFRLALTAATAQVLKNGLYLLGIETLEQM